MINQKRADAVAVYFRRSGASNLPQGWNDEDLYNWLHAKGYVWREAECAWRSVRILTSIREASRSRATNPTPAKQEEHQFTEVIAALRQNDKAHARELLRPILINSPSPNAWVLAARAAQSVEQSVLCLENALKLDRSHRRAKQELQRLQNYERATQKKPRLRSSLRKLKRNLIPSARSQMSVKRRSSKSGQ